MATKRKAIRAGMLLLANDRDPSPIELHGVREDLPTGVTLSECRATRAASDVFSATELEERIANYAARAAAKLPLFTKTSRADATPDPRADIVCWACGLTAAREGNTCQKASDGTRRWTSRMHNAHTTEIYCPECFDVWGWPDEYAAEVERLNRLSDDCARAEKLAGGGAAAVVQPARPDAGRVRRERREVVPV